jgi:hypothetical protein
MCLVKFVSSVERAMVLGCISGRVSFNRRKCQVVVLMLGSIAQESHVWCLPVSFSWLGKLAVVDIIHLFLWSLR